MARERNRIDLLIAAAAFLIAAVLCVLGFIKIVPMLLNNPAHINSSEDIHANGKVLSERKIHGPRLPGLSFSV